MKVKVTFLSIHLFLFMSRLTASWGTPEQEKENNHNNNLWFHITIKIMKMTIDYQYCDENYEDQERNVNSVLQQVMTFN